MYENSANYIATKLINSKNILNQEVIKFAKDKDFEFPLATKLLSLKEKTDYRIKKTLRKIRK